MMSKLQKAKKRGLFQQAALSLFNAGRLSSS